jgi:flavin reductase (DIM6/NTAB) family NADH-FMN oxidoreductase RutF
MFKEIRPEEITDNAIKLIGTDSMLITAGKAGDFNTMTAAWGGLGYIWKKPVAYILIRPQRFTYQFTERYDWFSLGFFGGEHQDILDFCGSCSGRDTDKVKETGLTVLEYEDKALYFEQSRLTLICRKLYYQDIDPANFIEKSLERMYPLRDYHRMYIGHIEKVLVKTGQA